MNYNCKEKVTFNNLKKYQHVQDYEYDSDCRL